MKFNFILGVIVIVIFSGCSPKYYAPDAHNVPLIKEKGETDLNLFGNGNRVDFQASHGLSDQFSLKANGSIFRPEEKDNGDGGSGDYGELGFGYYKPIGKHWVFETYAIGGFGKMKNHFPSAKEAHPSTSGKIKSDVLRFGLQPNFGFKSKYFTAALSSRFVNLNYQNVKGDLIYNDEDQEKYLKDNASNFLVEPALTIRVGVENFKLQMQYGFSVNLSNKDFRQRYNFITLGVNVNLK